MSILKQIYDNFKLYPFRCSLTDYSKNLTYAELDQWSGNIQNYINQKVSGKYKIIAIHGHPSVLFYSLILGVLRSGNIFINIDKNLPIERKLLLLNSLEVDLLFDLNELPLNAKLSDDKKKNKSEIECIVNSIKKTHQEEFEFNEDRPAYIYFTSGTTGIPKAIIGKYSSLSHFINWQKNNFSINNGVKVAQITSPSFDVSLRELFLPLVCAGTLYIPDENEKFSPNFISWMRKNEIDILHVVPTVALNWLSYISDNIELENISNETSLKYIFFAGEPLNKTLIDKWRRYFGNNAKLINLYGPTETTLAKTWYLIPENNEYSSIPVGYPISDTNIYILDENLEKINSPQIEGDIFIDTIHSTFGYYKNELEQERAFIKNPFLDGLSEKLYRTGDIGYWGNDFLLFLKGRKDQQIKINGIRIELEEIKYYILKFDGIENIEIIYDSLIDSKKKQLVAFFTKKSKAIINVNELRDFLLDFLPVTLIPVIFIEIDRIPITNNGKINRNELNITLKKFLSDSKSISEVANINEKYFLQILSTILQHNDVNINDNLYSIGLSSLKVFELINFLNHKYRINISPKEIFKLSTLKELFMLFKSKDIFFKENTNINYSSTFRLSNQQLRFKNIYLSKLNHTWSLMYAEKVINKTMDLKLIEKAIKNIILNHDSLKLYFVVDSNEVWQNKISHENEISIMHYCIKDFSYQDQLEKITKLKEETLSKNINPFNWPLFRINIINTSSKQFIITFTIHHLIFDGYSQGLFFEEFDKYLDNEKDFKSKSINTYQEFVVSQEIDSDTETNKKYWLDLFKGFTSSVFLNSFNNVQTFNDFKGRSYSQCLTSENHERVLIYCKNRNVTCFEFFLMIYVLTIDKLQSFEDIVISFPALGRENTDFLNTLGNFINMILIRINKKNIGDNTDSLLNEISNQVRQGVTNGRYQFDELANELGLECTIEKQPITTILFNSVTHSEKINEAFDKKNIEMYQDVRYDIMGILHQFTDGIKIEFQYKRSKFSVSQISDIMEHFHYKLDMILNLCNYKLK